MADIPTWFFLLTLGGFGLLFGSFANVVIWRLPRHESLSSPASHCPKCGTPIAWHDNIPVLSWLILRGRCRACASSISVRYPFVECASGALWVLAGVTFGMTAKTGLAVALFYMLLILTFIDIDHQRLPNVLVAVLGLIGAGGVVLAQFTGLDLVPLVGRAGDGVFSSPVVISLLGLTLGGGVSLAIAAVYGAVRGKTGLGMGDVKLLGVLGLFLGPFVLMALMAGSVLGAIYGLALAPKDEGLHAVRIPFGPFLAAGGIMAATVGPVLWMAYARVVGLVS